ncbi:MAG: hypothetical protein LBG99_05470 [Propionibacteriaceae bacterium]|nr:hypothetical protein [Propionibacteriaceae bacterium]
MVFSLELVDRSALDVVWLPRVVVRDIDWMTVVHPVHQKSKDTPATIFEYHPNEFPGPKWEIGTIVGGIVRILCFAFSGEGDDLVFDHFVPRQGDRRPYIIPALRFPKKLFVDEYATWW